MFLANKYTRWYTSICEQARGRTKITGEHELHHVVPKIFGGTEMVALTFREHFLCHWLLTKMLPPGSERQKMIYALHAMSRKSKTNNRRVSAWQYEVSRRAQARAMADREVTDKTRAKMSQAKKGHVPWNKGTKGLQTSWKKGLKGVQTGWRHSPEARMNQSLKQLGRPKQLSKEGRQRLQENGRRAAVRLRETGILKGRIPWNKGRVFIDPAIAREKRRAWQRQYRAKNALTINISTGEVLDDGKNF